MPSEFRDFVYNTAEVMDVNQEIQSTDEWALKNLDYVSFTHGPLLSTVMFCS